MTANGDSILSAVIPALDGDDDSAKNEAEGGEGGGAGTIVVETLGFFDVRDEFDAPFLRGDSNGDLQVQVTDALHTLNYLFLGGTTPRCFDAADSNDDGEVELVDAVQTLSFLFLTGTTMPSPGTFIPGFDSTADSLYCQPGR